VQAIEHPCIVRIIEILEDNKHYYIVSELLSEELAKRWQRRGTFNENQAAVIMHQVLLALNYLHLNNIVHRDVKLENVLMQTNFMEDLTLKLTDFGFAKVFQPELGLTEVLGSPLYMAPEMLLKHSYGTLVDVWAAGVMMHILVFGIPPF
jgi:serine/threonine protein kinase